MTQLAGTIFENHVCTWDRVESCERDHRHLAALAADVSGGGFDINDVNAGVRAQIAEHRDSAEFDVQYLVAAVYTVAIAA